MSLDSTLSDLAIRRQQLRHRLIQCREATLRLFAAIEPELLGRQAHPEFSPVGWHLGHIAYTEAKWLLQTCGGFPPLFPEYHRLFAADGLPKSERGNLPAYPQLLAYLDTVRTQVLNYLAVAPLAEQERLWRWIVQHESQHCETVTLVLSLQRFPPLSFATGFKQGRDPDLSDMVQILAGEFLQGSQSLDALDNESPCPTVHLERYWIDRFPVTCQQYRQFMEAGGYHDRRWWSEAGWNWLQSQPVTQPLYWIEDSALAEHPVCGVSWYEAEAYARFVGKRLPTEAEWEKAASPPAPYPWGDSEPTDFHCNHNHTIGWTTPVGAYPAGKSAAGCFDLLGNVWEWTNSWFEAYPGFEVYPYKGYSQVYFDRQHRVLRGGSWATRPWAMRSSFRNWYQPHIRQIFAGFRCAYTD